jgi:hypothetical protein
LQVAGQVRDIRKARHLSQRQLAGGCRCPAPTSRKSKTARRFRLWARWSGWLRPSTWTSANWSGIPAACATRKSRHLCRSVPGRDCRLLPHLEPLHRTLFQARCGTLPWAAAARLSWLPRSGRPGLPRGCVRLPVLGLRPASAQGAARLRCTQLRFGADCGAWALVLGSMVLHLFRICGDCREGNDSSPVQGS